MRILLLCLIPLLAACQSRGVLPPPAPIAPEGRDHAQLGQIVELASGQVITPQQLVERLARASRVLVGEQHDNPDHHALQLWLSRALAAQRPQGSLLLEMLNPDQQARVEQVQAEVRAGRMPVDTIAALAWQPGWDWGLYGALVQYQLRQPYPLLAANSRLELIGNGSMLFTWQGSNPQLNPVLLMAHMDVVPIAPGEDDKWQYPPFSGELAEGFVWGRGTIDTKGSMIAMLEAAELLISQGFTPERSVLLSFGADEEIGGYHGNRVTAEHLQRQGYDTAQVSDPLWVRDDKARTYLPLTAANALLPLGASVAPTQKEPA